MSKVKLIPAKYLIGYMIIWALAVYSAQNYMFKYDQSFGAGMLAGLPVSALFCFGWIVGANQYYNWQFKSFHKLN